MCKKPDETAAPVKVKMRRPIELGLPAIPTLPAPLVLRRAQANEAGALAGLLGRAYVDEVWEPKATERELFHDDTVKAVFVVEAEGRLVATASLQVGADNPDFGRLRWVATEQAWRRKGLAEALVIHLLSITEKAGCKETHLQTTTDLLGAIALYLKLEFEPLISSQIESDEWKRVFRLLRRESSL